MMLVNQALHLQAVNPWVEIYSDKTMIASDTTTSLQMIEWCSLPDRADPDSARQHIFWTSKEKSDVEFEFHTAKVVFSSQLADVWSHKKGDVWFVNKSEVMSAQILGW